MSRVCKDTETEPKLTSLSGEELQGRTSHNSSEVKVEEDRTEQDRTGLEVPGNEDNRRFLN